MEFVADVHVKTAYVSALRNEGHDVLRVVDIDELGQTATDCQIVEFANDRDAVVLTNDRKDFARLDCHSGSIGPQTGTIPGERAAAVTRIERLVTDLSETTLYAAGWSG